MLNDAICFNNVYLVTGGLCKRSMLLEGRERNNYLIRRLKCCKCGKLHRELPDFMAPFKQYAVEIVEDTFRKVILKVRKYGIKILLFR